MNRYFSILITLILVFAAVLSCEAADVDPILIDKPSNIVFECNKDLIIEIPNPAVISYSVSGRNGDPYFLFINAEFLFLVETPWKGLDKSSFSLKYSPAGGSEEIYPLNYMMTCMMSMRNGWKTFSDRLTFATLVPLCLVFDVPVRTNQGWSLIFSPAERGGTPPCTIEIPLKIQ